MIRRPVARGGLAREARFLVLDPPCRILHDSPRAYRDHVASSDVEHLRARGTDELRPRYLDVTRVVGIEFAE